MTQPRLPRPQRKGESREDNTLNAALGCAATVALVVIVVLIADLWTL